MKKILSIFALLMTIVIGAKATDVVLYSYVDGTENINTAKGVVATIRGTVQKNYKGQKYNNGGTTPNGTITCPNSLAVAGDEPNQYINNCLKLEIEGGFKTGDKISISSYINNSDETKVGVISLYTFNTETPASPNKLADWTATDGKRTAGTPEATEYTLTADADSLFFGRQMGLESATRTNILTIVVTRADASVLDAPEISQSENTITMTAADGATIYYTTDGTAPSTTSNVYDATNKPVITADCTVKAYAVKSGMTDSDVTSFSAKYCIATTSTFNFSENGWAASSTKDGVYVGSVNFPESSASVDGISFTKRLQFGGGSRNDTRYFSFIVNAPCNIVVYVTSNSNNSLRGFGVSTGVDYNKNVDIEKIGYNMGGYLDAVYYAITGTGLTKVNISNTGDSDMGIYGFKVVYGNENSYTMSIGSAGYATLALPYAVEIPSGVTAYTGALNAAGTAVTMTEITDGIIPANTGVVLQGTAGSYTFSETTEAGTATSSISGTDSDSNVIEKETDSYYVLFKDGDNVGFTKVTNNTYKCIPAHKAYVQVAAGGTDALPAEFADATAVEAVAETKAEAVAPVKVIKNGQLFIGNFNVVGQQVK